MKRWRAPLTRLFSLAGGILVLFVALPLIATLLATTPAEVRQTLLDPQVLQSLGLTFLAGALATGIAVLLGLPLAYLLARYRFRGKGIVEGLMDLPIVIPHTAAGIALLMVFGSKGVFGRLLAPFGLYFVDTLAGIVVAMLFVSLPYLVNMSRESFALIDSELEQAASVDGASAWQAIWLVTLPIAWRGIAGGALMMWARGISEFGAVIILAYHPSVITVLLYERFAGFGLSAALPVTVVLLLFVLLIFGFLRFFLIPERLP